MSEGKAGPPEQIVLIRHGEKPIRTHSAAAAGSEPATAPPAYDPSGIDVHGMTNQDCLIPRGWQRAGALAVLFDPMVGPFRSPLTRPKHLHSPKYATHDKTINHRTYETILPLSERLVVPIKHHFEEGEEGKLASHIVKNDGDTSLVCWEHTNIELIAKALPLADSSPPIPSSWPDGRFDVIWLFSLSAADPPAYTFTQLPQLLLDGDAGI